MIFFSVVSASVLGAVLIGLSEVFPLLYNAPDNVRSIASFMIVISSLGMPFFSYAHAAYFTLRSGGKVAVTLLFDCVYMWTVVVPIVVLVTNFTNVSIYWLFIIANSAEAAKAILGAICLKKVNWAKQLVAKN